MKSSSIAGSLLVSLAHLKSRMLKQMDAYFGVHGISFTEFLILHAVFGAEHEMLRRIDLANRIGITASGVTRLLRPMERIGLVENESNPRDARVSLVRLTPAGKTKYREALITFEQGAASLCSALTSEEQSTMFALTKKLS